MLMNRTQPDVIPTARYELREVAHLLGVHKASVLRWTKQGKIKNTARQLNSRKVWTGAEILRFWRLNA